MKVDGRATENKVIGLFPEIKHSFIADQELLIETTCIDPDFLDRISLNPSAGIRLGDHLTVFKSITSQGPIFYLEDHHPNAGIANYYIRAHII
jgi:hypothetical protein